jgi:serine/threonine protein kinase
MDNIGKYKIIKELGHGATSTVYLAVEPGTHHQVAVKLFNLDVLHNNERSKAFRKLIESEASLAGKLSHPHIVKINGICGG